MKANVKYKIGYILAIILAIIGLMLLLHPYYDVSIDKALDNPDMQEITNSPLMASLIITSGLVALTSGIMVSVAILCITILITSKPEVID